MMLDYEVIVSGSSGNCVIIEDVMIDCGIGYKAIEDKLYSIKYLLLTHNHSDHIKRTTLASIKKRFPHITIIGNYEVHAKYGVDIISNETFPVITEHYTFIPFNCHHDCKVHGYIWQFGELDIIYATDTSTLKDAPPLKYDYLFLESNHDEKKLDKCRVVSKNYDSWRSGLRHLSTQSSRLFYFMNRKNKKSVWVELHKSYRFY